MLDNSYLELRMLNRYSKYPPIYPRNWFKGFADRVRNLPHETFLPFWICPTCEMTWADLSEYETKPPGVQYYCPFCKTELWGGYERGVSKAQYAEKDRGGGEVSYLKVRYDMPLIDGLECGHCSRDASDVELEVINVTVDVSGDCRCERIFIPACFVCIKRQVKDTVPF